MEVGAANEATQHLLCLHLMTLAADSERPTQLEPALEVDPESDMGQEVIRLYNKRRGRFRWRAVQSLRKPIAELWQIVAEMEEEGEGRKDEG